MSTSNYYRAPGMPQDESLDHIVTATALDGHVRAIGIRATATVAKALEIHNTCRLPLLLLEDLLQVLYWLPTI